MQLTFSDSSISTSTRPFVIGCAAGAVTVLAVQTIRRLSQMTMAEMLDTFSLLPGVMRIVKGEVEGPIRKLTGEVHENLVDPLYQLGDGVDIDTVIVDAKRRLQSKTVSYERTQISGAVYYDNKDYIKLAQELVPSALALNPMHSDLWPGVRQMEAELLAWTGAPLHAQYGTVTGGGTESNMLAVLSYREKMREKYPGRRSFNIVIPSSAHHSFHRAAHYFMVDVIEVPVTKDYKADVRAMRRAINAYTIAIVGSAPSYPAGICDPIAELGKLAIEKKVPFHVDGCLGGIVIPRLKKMASIGFDVEGVTSISVDPHKFGMSPMKGVSTIFWKEREMRHLSYFKQARSGCGVTYSHRMVGSYPGLPIVLAWGAFRMIGEENYISSANGIVTKAQQIYARVKKEIPELKVKGDPKLMVVAFESANEKTLPIYCVFDEMKIRKWNLSNILGGFHLCVSDIHRNHPLFVNQFIRDLKESVTAVLESDNPKPKGVTALYGSVTTIPLDAADDVGCAYLDALSTLPERVDSGGGSASGDPK